MTFSRCPVAFSFSFAILLSVSCKFPENPIRAGQAGNGAISLDHKIMLGGVAHADGLCQPVPNCSACHGPTLQGGKHNEPSCVKCHGALWDLPGCGKGTVSHSASLGGTAHAPNYCAPIQNCAGCHGADLRGGSNGQPSCYQCHGDLWSRPGCGTFSTTHTVSLGGVLHASAYCAPYQNCTSCHGGNLRGGARGEPSCLSCHTQRAWMDCGSVQHNRNKEGHLHASDYCQPAQYCSPCHAANLRGGPNGEPSCYQCHGADWNDCGRR